MVYSVTFQRGSDPSVRVRTVHTLVFGEAKNAPSLDKVIAAVKVIYPDLDEKTVMIMGTDNWDADQMRKDGIKLYNFD